MSHFPEQYENIGKRYKSTQNDLCCLLINLVGQLPGDN